MAVMTASIEPVDSTSTSANVVLVTPEIAEQWLDRNPRNRRVVWSRVLLYAAQMKSGTWRLTHQGIAFDESGNLVDGQHRLLAVISSSVPTRFWVFNGVSREAMIAIDTGKARSAEDAFVLLGDDATRRSVAVSRILYGLYALQAGKTERLDIAFSPPLERLRVFHEAMRDAVEFSMVSANEKGLRHACVAAAIASAWFTQNKELLSQFKQDYSSGVITSEADLGAIRIRNFVLTSSKTRGGREARSDLFLRACTALRAYVERRPIQKLYAARDSVFGLPPVEGA